MFRYNKNNNKVKKCFPFLLTNKGNNAEVSSLIGWESKEELKTERCFFPNFKEILPMTYDVLFNHYPINKNIILAFYDDGITIIHNLKHEIIKPKVKRKQKIPKNEFIQDLNSYFLKIAGLDPKHFSLLKN